MRATLAGASSLLLGMGLLMLGAGLQGTLLGVRATLDGFSTLLTGSIMACYYVGYLGGSLGAPPLVQRVGHIRVFAALSSVAAATILLQGLLVSAPTWALLRAVSGFCFAGIYVVAESWLNHRADNRSRATVLGTYMVVIYLGLGLGQLLLKTANPQSPVLFIVVAVLISIAVVPIALTAQHAPDFSLPQRVRVRELLAVSPFGVIGVLFSGAAAGTVFSVGPVYAAASGFGTGGVAAYMASSILTAVAAQLPIGRASDRFDRRTVLASMSLLATAAALAALALAARHTALFYLPAALFGALTLSVYSLSVAHINDYLQPAQMVGASGTLILVNGFGAVLGPIAVTGAMQAFDARAYFVALTVLHLAFAGYALWRKGRRGPMPTGQKTAFVAAAPQAAPTGLLSAQPESE